MAQLNPIPSLPNQLVIVDEFNGHQYSKIGSQWKYFIPGSSLSYNVNTETLSIKYVATASEIEKLAVENSLNLTRLSSNLLGWYRYSFNSATTSIFDKARACKQNSNVESVDIKTSGIYFQTPNDPQFSTSWHLQNGNDADIDMPEAWNIQTGAGSNILISIIDSGIDWEHEDLGMGTDGYQNIYLNSGEDAWSNPNDPTTGNGSDDDGNGYIDDWKGWNFFDSTNDARENSFHGTHTAGIVAAKTNNGKGISGIAGGWGVSGCKILTCSLGPPGINLLEELPNAITYSVNMGAKIINLSIGAGPSIEIDDAIEYAYENGVTIIAASGNEGVPVVGTPANHPYTISVGGTLENDTKTPSANFGTHLDLAAPSVNIRSTQIGNTYGASGGTSFAAPQVTGVAALMLSENPCLGFQQIKDILTATADKVGGYYYTYNPLIPGKSNELGYGRLNAHKAVIAASQSYKPGIDLYMRDRYNDVGSNMGYEFTWDFDESPDIWVRNDPDGFALENQVHEAQSFEFNPSDSLYVYVRIGNRGCTSSFGTEKLKLYSSAAATNSGWPQDWDGSSWPVGIVIGAQTIPVLLPGESVILQFPWYNTIAQGQCLLARVENSPLDPIIVFPQDLAQDVYQNNNIAMRNVYIHNIYPGIEPPIVEGIRYPFGGFVHVGNSFDTQSAHDVVFKTPEDEPGKPLTEEAEVVVMFDSIGWDLFYPQIIGRTDMRILGNRTVRLFSNDVTFSAIPFDAHQRVPIYVGYSFLSQELTEKRNFGYHVIQKHTNPHPTIGEHWTGSVHFYITKYARNPFGARAGSDRTIQRGEETTLNADLIQEDAIYNWYDVDGNLVYTGTSFNATSDITQKYKLEVIADIDGVKDYDEVEVKVNPFYITAISPNPANVNVTIGYEASEASSACFVVAGNSNSYINNYILDSAENEVLIDVTSFPAGVYTVALVCDGVVRDAKQISVQ